MLKHRASVAWVLALAFGVALLYLNSRIDRVEAAPNKPVATPTMGAVPGLQVARAQVPGGNPGVGNANSVKFYGQVVDFAGNKAPFVAVLQTISIAADPFERHSLSLGFDASCATTLGATAYECTLTPQGGGNWLMSGTLAARFFVTTANGDTLIGNINVPVNQ
jgi:hypothetical protein